MFGFGSIGGSELLFILVLALLLFGPRRIPEIGRTIGKTLTQLRRATQEFRSGIEREVEVEKLREAGDAMRSIRSEVGSVTKDALGSIRREVDGAAREVKTGAAADAVANAPKPEPVAPPEQPSDPGSDESTDHDDPDREQRS
jgi:Tat protein translocase TatB subunit